MLALPVRIITVAVETPVKLAAHAYALPGQVRSGYEGVRRDGVTATVAPLLGAAAVGAIRLSVAAVTLPGEVAERLRHLGGSSAPEPARVPVYSPAARAAGAPGTATAAAEAAEREEAARLAAVDDLSDLDDEDTPWADPSEAVAASTGSEVPDALPVPDRDDLPLADFDHMTLGSLRSRLSRLSLSDLLALRAYEQAHADRLPVVTMLENRIAKVRRMEQG